MESLLVPFHDTLRHLSRTDADRGVRRRAQCLRGYCASESLAQAARLVGVSSRQLQRWSLRFLAEGRDGLADRPRSGRPRKLDADAETFIECALADLPTAYAYPAATWTIADLQDLLARHGWLVSQPTVDRALHRLGYRYRRPRHDLHHRQDADSVATAQQTLAVLQKKGIITREEYDSCMSMSVICTPIPTWQKSGDSVGSPTAFPLLASTSEPRSSGRWSIAPDA